MVDRVKEDVEYVHNAIDQIIGQAIKALKILDPSIPLIITPQLPQKAPVACSHSHQSKQNKGTPVILNNFTSTPAHNAHHIMDMAVTPSPLKYSSTGNPMDDPMDDPMENPMENPMESPKKEPGIPTSNEPLNYISLVNENHKEAEYVPWDGKIRNMLHKKTFNPTPKAGPSSCQVKNSEPKMARAAPSSPSYQAKRFKESSHGPMHSRIPPSQPTNQPVAQLMGQQHMAQPVAQNANYYMATHSMAPHSTAQPLAQHSFSQPLAQHSMTQPKVNSKARSSSQYGAQPTNRQGGVHSIPSRPNETQTSKQPAPKHLPSSSYKTGTRPVVSHQVSQPVRIQNHSGRQPACAASCIPSLPAVPASPNQTINVNSSFMTDWAQEKNLNTALKQQNIDVVSLFGAVKPINTAEVFSKNV